jgi:hypothetical protein
MHLKLEQEDGRKKKFYLFIYLNFLFRTLGGCLQESTHCYTLEVSFFSYQTSTNSQAIPYTEELCKENIFFIDT